RRRPAIPPGRQALGGPVRGGAARARGLHDGPPPAAGGRARAALMPQYMLDTNICIYVVKDYPAKLRERFNRLAEQLCISTVTLAELHYGAEKSARRLDNLEAIRQFVARLEVLPFSAAAAAHYGEIRAALERAGTPAGAYD